LAFLDNDGFVFAFPRITIIIIKTF
jgi:hypothetical protein